MLYAKKCLSILLAIILLWDPSYMSLEVQAETVSLELMADSKKISQVYSVNPFDLSKIGFEKGKTFQGQSSFELLLIRDLHCQEEAQTSIAKAIQKVCQFSSQIKDSTQFFPILLEGASGPLQTTLFTSFPDSEIRQRSAEKVMKEGYLSGAEYAAIVMGMDSHIQLYGVEDENIYLENFKIFRHVRNSFNKIQGDIEKINQWLDQIRQKNDSEDMKQIEKMKNALDEGKIEEVAAFVEKHLELGDVKQKSENIHLMEFFQLLQSQKAISQDQITKELKRVMADLEKCLSQEEMKTVIQRSLEFRLGKIKTLGYLSQIQKMHDENIKNVSFHQKYPTLSQWYDISEKQEQIDVDELVSDLEKFIVQLRENEAKRLGETLLIQWSDQWSLLNKLMKLELSRKELQKENQVLNLEPHIYFSFSICDIFGSLLSILNASFCFYQLALKRDQVMTENALKAVSRIPNRENEIRNTDDGILETGDRGPVTILVTGGFHTEGIQNILEKENISYTTWTPIIKSQINSSCYEKIMMDQGFNFENTEFSEKRLAWRIDENTRKTLAAPLLLWKQLSSERQEVLVGFLKDFVEARGRSGQSLKKIMDAWLKDHWTKLSGDEKELLIYLVSLYDQTFIRLIELKDQGRTIAKLTIATVEAFAGRGSVLSKLTRECFEGKEKRSPSPVRSSRPPPNGFQKRRLWYFSFFLLALNFMDRSFCVSATELMARNILTVIETRVHGFTEEDQKDLDTILETPDLDERTYERASAVLRRAYVERWNKECFSSLCARAENTSDSATIGVMLDMIEDHQVVMDQRSYNIFIHWMETKIPIPINEGNSPSREWQFSQMEMQGIYRRIASVLASILRNRPELFLENPIPLLERLLRLEVVDRVVYKSAYKLILAIHEIHPEWIPEHSLSGFVVSMSQSGNDDKVDFLSYPHADVLLNSYFEQATRGMTAQDQYSIGLTVWHFLRRYGIDISNGLYVQRAIDLILEQRRQYASRIVFGSNTFVVNAMIAPDLHEPRVIAEIEALERSAGVPTASIQTIHEFYTTLYYIRSHQGPVTVFLKVHGNGVDIGTSDARESVDYRSIVDALIERERAGLDISQVTIFNMGCYGADFDLRLMNSLSVAITQGRVSNLPVVISIAEFGMPVAGSLIVPSHFFYSAILSRVHHPSQPLTIQDVFNAEIEALHSDPQREPKIFIEIDPREIERLFPGVQSQPPWHSPRVLEIGQLTPHQQTGLQAGMLGMRIPTITRDVSRVSVSVPGPAPIAPLPRSGSEGLAKVSLPQIPSVAASKTSARTKRSPAPPQKENQTLRSQPWYFPLFLLALNFIAGLGCVSAAELRARNALAANVVRANSILGPIRARVYSPERYTDLVSSTVSTPEVVYDSREVQYERDLTILEEETGLSAETMEVFRLLGGVHHIAPVIMTRACTAEEIQRVGNILITPRLHYETYERAFRIIYNTAHFLKFDHNWYQSRRSVFDILLAVIRNPEMGTQVRGDAGDFFSELLITDDMSHDMIITDRGVRDENHLNQNLSLFSERDVFNLIEILQTEGLNDETYRSAYRFLIGLPERLFDERVFLALENAFERQGACSVKVKIAHLLVMNALSNPGRLNQRICNMLLRSIETQIPQLVGITHADSDLIASVQGLANILIIMIELRVDLPQANLVPMLERVLRLDGIDPIIYRGVAQSLHSIHRVHPEWISRHSLAEFILTMPEEPSAPSYPHADVLVHPYFQQATQGLSAQDKYSIGLTVWKFLRRYRIDMNNALYVQRAVDLILTQRRQYGARIIFGPNTFIVNPMIAPEESSPRDIATMERLERSAGVPAASIQTVHEFDTMLYYIRSHPGPITVFLIVHGDEDYVGDGNPLVGENMHFTRLAEALIDRARAGLDVHQVTLFNLGCFGADFDLNLMNTLSVSLEQGQIPNLPVVISTAPFGYYGLSTSANAIGQSEADLFRGHQEGQPLTIQGLFNIELEMMNSYHDFTIYIGIDPREIERLFPDVHIRPPWYRTEVLEIGFRATPQQTGLQAGMFGMRISTTTRDVGRVSVSVAVPGPRTPLLATRSEGLAKTVSNEVDVAARAEAKRILENSHETDVTRLILVAAAFLDERKGQLAETHFRGRVLHALAEELAGRLRARGEHGKAQEIERAQGIATRRERILEGSISQPAVIESLSRAAVFDQQA